MANTYHQVFVHIVFSVKHRQNLIPKDKKEELHKYISGVIAGKNCKAIKINSMPDHVHILAGLNPQISISNLVKDIKISTNKFINDNKWTRQRFKWQDGFGVFSYSKSQIGRVSKYIQVQEEHHKTLSFREEYLDFLNKYGIEYDKKYVFDLE